MMVEALIIGVFGTLGVDLVEIPFTLESARSSFLKTIQKVPPSDTTQEFKDGVLWADCVGLLSSDDVTLVTNDLAFYAGRNLDKGLAPELKAEVENQPHVLHVIPKITDRYPTNAFHTA